MKTAIIAPSKTLWDFATTDYHLCLSHLILTDPLYTSFYRERSQRGHWVILDNSAHEMSIGAGFDELIRAAKLIQPTEIVLPDRLFFGDDTTYRSTQAYHIFRDELPRTLSLMGCPQGRTRAEWFTCLRSFLSIDIQSIGISKDYEVWDDGIVGLIELVKETNPNWDIHLLGWGRQLNDLRTIQTLYSDIRGTDSAKPTVFALNNLPLMINLETQEVFCTRPYPGRPSNYFSLSRADFPFLKLVEWNNDVFGCLAEGKMITRNF